MRMAIPVTISVNDREKRNEREIKALQEKREELRLSRARTFEKMKAQARRKDAHGVAVSALQFAKEAQAINDLTRQIKAKKFPTRIWI